MKKGIVPVHFKILLKLYLIAALNFFAFRLFLFAIEMDRIGDAPFRDILYAFCMGVRFDIVVSSYLLVLPAVILSIFSFIGKKNIPMEKTLTIFLTLVFFVAFMVCGADIPYFHQFFDRFNIGAFSWMDGDGGAKFVVKMILEEPSYWLPIVLVVASTVDYFLSVRKVFKKTQTWEKGNYVSKSIFTILIIGGMFLGIRGRIDEKSPIRTGTAYFCNNSFLNQLGLNPNFTLFQSYANSSKNQEHKFMDDETALENVQKYLKINEINDDFPISREIQADTLPNNYNVVIVIMESMSANKLARHGNKLNLTPFLDSLSYKGLYFDNCYTSGTHTYCGIFTTLCSYPVVYRRHPLKTTPILQYNGIANVLKKNGYSTVFFVTHDSQFDNMGGFLTANDFEQVVSKPDYPSREVKTTLGVPDDFMFRFSIPIINKLHEKGKPFLSVFLTASDHGPYYLPDYFKPHSESISEKMVEYADYSLKTFMENAERQPWYDSTLFVFVADHGSSMDATYSLPESYIHTPLIFHCPSLIQDSTLNSCVAGQMDIFPTVMGLLNVSYQNNTLGIDLLRENRPYIFSFADDKYAVLDTEWMLIVNYNDPKPCRLYKYKEKSLKDCSEDFSEKTLEMKKYAESNFQIFQYLTRNRKQFQ